MVRPHRLLQLDLHFPSARTSHRTRTAKWNSYPRTWRALQLSQALQNATAPRSTSSSFENTVPSFPPHLQSLRVSSPFFIINKRRNVNIQAFTLASSQGPDRIRHQLQLFCRTLPMCRGYIKTSSSHPLLLPQETTSASLLLPSTNYPLEFWYMVWHTTAKFWC